MEFSIIDYLYILGRPLAYISMGLGLWRIIQTKSTKSFSITAWALGLLMIFAIFIRSLFSLHDFLFWLNAMIGIVFSVVEFALIWKWRHQ